MGFKVELTGFADIDKVLANLGSQASSQVQKKAYTAAGRVLRDKARELISKKSGETAESIEVASDALGVDVYVGPNIKKGGWKAGWIERGTAPHVIRSEKKLLSNGETVYGKSVKHPGTSPHPFMRPAWELLKGDMAGIIRDNIGKAVFSYMKKTIKNNR